MGYAAPPADLPRCPGPSMQDILSADGEAAPAVLREQSFLELGDAELAVERYTSQAFHQREMDKMWRKVWQMACRLEQIPQVGDHCVYDIGDDSLFVTRTSPTEIKAFYNACLHRGTRLRDEGGLRPGLPVSVPRLYLGPGRQSQRRALPLGFSDHQGR